MCVTPGTRGLVPCVQAALLVISLVTIYLLPFAAVTVQAASSLLSAPPMINVSEYTSDPSGHFDLSEEEYTSDPSGHFDSSEEEFTSDPSGHFDSSDDAEEGKGLLYAKDDAKTVLLTDSLSSSTAPPSPLPDLDGGRDPTVASKGMGVIWRICHFLALSPLVIIQFTLATRPVV